MIVNEVLQWIAIAVIWLMLSRGLTDTERTLSAIVKHLNEEAKR